MYKEYNCIEKWTHDIKPLPPAQHNELLEQIKQGGDAYKTFTKLAEWGALTNMQAIVFYCSLLKWKNIEQDVSHVDKYGYADILQRLGFKEEEYERFIFTPDDFMYLTHSVYVTGSHEQSSIKKVPKNKVDFNDEVEDVRELTGEMIHYHNKLIDAVDDAIVRFDKIKFIDVPQNEIEACRMEKDLQIEKE